MVVNVSVDDSALATAKVERRIWHEGYFTVESAVAADGITSPADQLLELLNDRMWPDPNAEELPDEKQSSIASRLLVLIEELGDGILPSPSLYNRLEPSLWELKVEGLRLTFYTTDGFGEADKVNGHFSHFTQYNLSESDLDGMSEIMRLGHYFGKDGQKAPQVELQKARDLREEDLEHDKPRN